MMAKTTPMYQNLIIMIIIILWPFSLLYLKP